MPWRYPAFKVKLALVVCAVLDAALLRVARDWRTRRKPRLRVAGATCILLWLVVLVFARTLDYL